MSSERVALILGAKGLVGSALLQTLTYPCHFQKVIAPTRKPLGELSGPTMVMNPIMDFAELLHHPEYFKVTDLFVVFGTTLKKAGSKEKFRSLELELTGLILQKARSFGVQSVYLISSIGANPRSVFFYSRIKGEIEEEALGLKFPSLYIFRPSLLLGEREESRPLEGLAQKMVQIILQKGINLQRRPPRKVLPFFPISREKLAQALFRASMDPTPGNHILTFVDIERLTQNKEITGMGKNFTRNLLP